MGRTSRGLFLFFFTVIFSASCLFSLVAISSVWRAIKTLSLAAGGSAQVGADNMTLSYAMGQPNARLMQAGSYELVSGYYGGTYGQGLTPRISSVTLNFVTQIDNLALGVPWDSPLKISFSELMHPEVLLSGAVSVAALRDKNGGALASSVSVQFAYDAAAKVLSIAPASAWAGNTLYELTVTTGATSAEGINLTEPYSRKFQTIFDSGQSNVFVDKNNEQIRLALAPQVLPENGFVVIKTNPLAEPDAVNPEGIRQANDKIAANGGAFHQAVALAEINAYGKDGGALEIAKPDLRLSLGYKDADADGIVDGTSPPLRASTLSLWVLDEKKNLWMKIAGSSVDRQARLVAAPIPHLSTFALIGSADTDVSEVYAFPVPWKPRAGDSARYGTLSEGITFVNLPSEGTLRLYTISGELVRAISFSSGALTLKWDASNDFGQSVASGVYIWEIVSGGNRKTGKLMIVW